MNGGESENSNSSQELKQQLIQASGAGNLADVKHLVEVLNIQHDKCRDVDGCTPLNYASYYGHLHIVKYLVEEVKVNLRECKSSDGYNALHSAAYNGKLDVVRYLIEDQDMDTDVRDYDGHTALYWANNRGWTRVATYLSSFEKCEYILCLLYMCVCLPMYVCVCASLWVTTTHSIVSKITSYQSVMN